MSIVYIVIDYGTLNGIDLYSYDNEDKAKLQFEHVINQYKEAFGEFDDKTVIEETYANISVNGVEMGWVELQESKVR